MTTLEYYVNTARTRRPTATLTIDGRRCYGIVSLRTSQAFGAGVSTGTFILRNPPVEPRIGMSIRLSWGYNGVEVPGFTGEIARPARKSYPNRYTLECRDVLWRADRSKGTISTSPLNSITASAAIRYILTTYGGIASSRIRLPTFSASGSEWGGSEWTLGILTPVTWASTSALAAAQEICSTLGYWLYADASGIIRAKLMERAPSGSPTHTFRRGVDLLTEGSPELTEDVDAVRNRIIVLGGPTGVLGAQITDTYQTSHPLLPSGVYQEDTVSSFLIEYVNPSEAGNASATSIAQRVLRVRSRTPVMVRHRVKADPRLAVGATVAIVDSGIGYTTARNFFLYGVETSFDAQTGDFSQNLTLDGGTGSTGYTTVPPPDASFSWTLMAETLDGDAVVEVSLDGSGSVSLTGGVIVSWAWSTATTTYGSTPNSATGSSAVFLFLASEGTADITLTVTDTTSKTDTMTQTIDLTGADTTPPMVEVLSVAGGAAWLVTPDGGATWNVETANGAAISVGTLGAGYDDRTTGTALTYGLLATRGALGAGGLRQTLDALATASTNSVANVAAITSNIWVNEGDPARVWFAIGTAVYRSLDGGLTKTAMAAAPASVAWIMEDPEVDNSVFLLAGANMYNATAPTVGWALLYAGPVGATARQFVRSRDGQVTWIAFTGAPASEALQRVESGAVADFTTTDVRSLALDRAASNSRAILYAVTADNPAQIWSFDGLTGLSAVQSSQFFPSGATVQHILASQNFDVIYCADFNSVAVNQGAVRKFFPGPDLLLLYKELAAGQNAHMLGLGGPAVSIAVELWVPTYGVTASNGVWRYTQATGWVLKNTGLPSNKYWYRIVANPSNADELILAGGSDGTGAVDSAGLMADSTPAFWRTTDAGLTWTALTISAGGALNNQPTMEFSSFMSGQWIIGGNAHYAVRGSGNASTASLNFGGSGDVEARFVVDGADGDLILSKGDGVWYFNAANSQTTISASGKPSTYRAPTERQIATTALIAVDQGLFGTHRGEVWYTSDYRSVDYSLITTVVNAGWVTSTLDGTVYLGGYNTAFGLQQVRQIADIAGAATESDVGPLVNDSGAARIGYIRADRQTRTVVAARIIRASTTSDLVVLTGGSWARLVGPSADGTTIADAVEVIVRG